MKTKCLILFTLLYAFTTTITATNIQAKVLCKNTKAPVEYVNVGIAEKNIGTVSNQDGDFSLTLTPEFTNDTLTLSCIGFSTIKIAIGDLVNKQHAVVYMSENVVGLSEILVKPLKTKIKALGVLTKSKSIQAGFQNNELGYECGILMKNRKAAWLKTLNLNIGTCTYDTIFYRLNVYKVTKRGTFENILTDQIFIKLSKSEVVDVVRIDLQKYNVCVRGNFMVTLEHVRDLGKGALNFGSGLSHKTYYRKTSQGNWKTVPIGVGINVVAEVEI